MLNSRKKIRALCDKKNKYSNSCCPKLKTITPPCKSNGRSLSSKCSASKLYFKYRF